MRVFNLKGEEVKSEEIILGGEYRITDIIRRDTFKGRSHMYFHEKTSNEEVVFITDAEGKQPFAIATNDSVRDDFAKNELSRIVPEVGYNVVWVSDNSKPAKPLFIFEITTVDPIDELAIDGSNVKCVFAGTTVEEIEPKFEEARHHIVRAFKQRNAVEQLRDKYCFNTSRNVMFTLMTEGPDGISTVKNKTKYTLNKNSKEKNAEGKQTMFFRVFHSKKFNKSRYVFVDGKQLTTENIMFNPDEYVRSDNSEIDIRKQLKLVTTLDGVQFYAMTTSKGVMRAIVRIGETFTSFLIHSDEMAVIKSVEPVYKDYSSQVLADE